MSLGRHYLCAVTMTVNNFVFNFFCKFEVGQTNRKVYSAHSLELTLASGNEARGT